MFPSTHASHVPLQYGMTALESLRSTRLSLLHKVRNKLTLYAKNDYWKWLYLDYYLWLSPHLARSAKFWFLWAWICWEGAVERLCVNLRSCSISAVTSTLPMGCPWWKKLFLTLDWHFVKSVNWNFGLKTDLGLGLGLEFAKGLVSVKLWNWHLSLWRQQNNVFHLKQSDMSFSILTVMETSILMVVDGCVVHDFFRGAVVAYATHLVMPLISINRWTTVVVNIIFI